MTQSPRSFDDRKASIEASIADALQQRGWRDIESAATETTPALALSDQVTLQNPADCLIDACNTTAAEIQSLGEAVVQFANTIAAETQALAELLRKHGAAIGSRVEEFTVMSKRIEDKVHAAHNDVLSASGGKRRRK
jgi:hypothetical protein